MNKEKIIYKLKNIVEAQENLEKEDIIQALSFIIYESENNKEKI